MGDVTTHHPDVDTAVAYKELIRVWAKRLRKDSMKMVTYLYPDLFKVIAEMEEEAGLEVI